MSPPRRPGDDRRAGRRPDKPGAPRDRRDTPSRGDKQAGGKPQDGGASRPPKPPRADRTPSPVRPPHRNPPPRDGASSDENKKRPNRASVRSFHRNAARGDAPTRDREVVQPQRTPRASGKPVTERSGSAARMKRTEAFSSRRDAERREDSVERSPPSARPSPSTGARARPDRARPQSSDRPVRRDRPPRDDAPARPEHGHPSTGERLHRRDALPHNTAVGRPASSRKRLDRAAPIPRVRSDGTTASGRGPRRELSTEAVPSSSSSHSKHEPQRIAKLLARAGIASRREIERMIEEGRIAIDGKVLDTPATIVTSLQGITVDGGPVTAPSATRLFLFNKPTGFLTAERDPKGRPTIYDRLPRDLPRVMPVGRLDLNTEGLLLLTTDGEFKRKLELPSSGIPRIYRARAYGEVSQQQLEALIEGVEIDGMRYGQIDANMERRTGRNVWIEIKITEGKNREVRRVLEYLGLQVSRLIRIAYGPFVLADLEPGSVVEVRQHDLVAFRQTLKQG